MSPTSGCTASRRRCTLRPLWTRDVTITTGLVDTYSTPTLLRLVTSAPVRRRPLCHPPLRFRRLRWRPTTSTVAPPTPERSKWFFRGRWGPSWRHEGALAVRFATRCQARMSRPDPTPRWGIARNTGSGHRERLSDELELPFLRAPSGCFRLRFQDKLPPSARNSKVDKGSPRSDAGSGARSPIRTVLPGRQGCAASPGYQARPTRGGRGGLEPPHPFGHRNLNPAVCQFRHSPERLEKIT